MSMGISKFGKQKQMKEMRTLNNLLEKFKNPTKADYATIAISIASHCCRFFTLCKTAPLNINHCQHPTSWLINVSGKRL